MRRHREPGFTALFLPASSPGQVIRFLERRARASGEPLPPGLLLSDPAGPQNLRALVAGGGEDDRAYLKTVAPAYAAAFSAGPVTLLWRRIAPGERAWGFAVWDKAGNETERDETVTPTASGGGPTFPSLPAGLARLAQAVGGGHAPGQPLTPEAIWAKRRGLSLDRVPALRPARAPAVPTLDYATVARLDQKSLLVEYSARWYRFAPAAEGADEPMETPVK